MAVDIKTVFLNVLDMETVEERQTYLDTACADDSELRQHVDRLLYAHENATGFLDPEAFGSDALNQPSVADASGTIIGRYELKEKLGEGGMAVVYRAEQKQPIHRQVAIKVIKLGMDTAEVITRFEAERQALAIMDHPNIAKVLDAGVTEAGKPYFVMELVRGISVTEYCDENRLNTQQRLELFVLICNAVHHAHQKGIIHRDLKPSNILVTLRDNKPVPVIIDFGIAKATHQKFTDKTLFTLHTQLIGTPEYMSPEQADIGDMDVDTRTDIYSLGVVLYELLAGTSPFDATTLRRAALGEIQRIIREEEPLRPSTRISAMGNAAKDIAARRGTNVAELTKRLNRELEWIPLKAMRKDRTRRYNSASAFADDINNYLNARWETDTPHWFLSGNPMNWGGMGYMGMDQFPDDWAREITDNWALNDVDGFFTEVAPSTRALKDWAGVHDQYTITPDTCWWALRGMYLHHVGTNANRITLNHLKGYNMEWGIPVAPEALDINFDPWGDQFSNFNAGKLLLILEGMTGVDYSVPDGTFTVADHMPDEWSYMELKLPVTQPGQTDWVNVRIDRAEGTNGLIDKTITVTGNPLPTLEIEPWLEEKALITAPAGYTNAPTNHIAYTYSATTNKTLAIQLQE